MASKPARERRPSGLMVVLAFAIAIAAAVALVVLAVVLRTGDDGAPPTATPGVNLAGIPQEGIVLGSPAARVTLIEYADLQCPACRAYTEEYFPEIVERYVRPGEIKTEFRGVAFIGEDSETVLRYVLAAGLQNHLWELQDALYRNQGAENSGWVTEELVRELAGEIPGFDADRLVTDAESDKVTAMMEQVMAQAEAADVPGTPTLAIQVGDAEPYLLASGISFAELTEALDAALAT
jgi:protein-disulfide isomerase